MLLRAPLSENVIVRSPTELDGNASRPLIFSFRTAKRFTLQVFVDVVQ